MFTRIKLLTAVCVAAAISTFMVVPATAQETSMTRKADRADTWEFLLPIDYMSSTTIKGDNGSSAHIDDDFGIEFGFGYHLNNHFQLNSLFNFNSLSYQATVKNDDNPPSSRKYSNYMDTFTTTLNGVYYLLDSNLTPFISGGVGFTYVDTNIQNGQASGTCWYDPWWGYICNTYVPTKTETDFNYNIGLGVRYDANRKFSIQGGYFKNWLDIGKASGTPDFDIWRLSLIFRM